MTPRPHSLGAFFLAIRPRTLPAALSPVLVAVAAADGLGHFRADVALGAPTVALLLQIASNLANDLFDFLKGADRGGRLGPLRTAEAGLLTTRALGIAVAVCLGLALLIGTYFVTIGGWSVVVLGVLAMLSAVAYTGGPFPLAYHGLGDLFAFAFFGPIAVMLTMHLMGAPLEAAAWLLGSAIGLLTTNILVVNNLRDVDQDRRAEKRTLVVRFGRNFGLLQYRGSLAGAYGLVVGGTVVGELPLACLLALLALPFGLTLERKLTRSEGVAMNALLAATARHLLGFALLLAVGLARWL